MKLYRVVLAAALLLASASSVFAGSRGRPTAGLPEAGDGRTREQIVAELEDRIRRASMQEIAAREAAERTPALPPDATPGPRGTPPTAAAQEPLLTSNDVVLFMDPLSANAREGQTITTTVKAVTQKPSSFDRVDLRLAFDPAILKPISVHYHTLRDNVAGRPEFEVDAANGRIHFSAAMAQPVSFSMQELISIVWLAVKQTPQTEVALGWPQQRSVLLSGENDLLASRILRGGNVVSMDMTVQPAATTALAPPFAASSEAFLDGQSMWLDIEGPMGPFEENEEFVVNVNLRNPDRKPFDTVSLLIRYPPDKASIVDWDRGNWIRTGTNIHDGDHILFPFNFYVANETDPKAGRIYYRMASTSAPLKTEGLLAQIRVRSLESGVSPEDFELVFSAEGGPRTTEISRDGTILLGLPQNAILALRAAR